MKKIIALLLIFLLSFSLVGCGKTQKSKKTNPASSQSTNTDNISSAPSEQDETSAPVTIQPEDLETPQPSTQGKVKQIVILGEGGTSAQKVLNAVMVLSVDYTKGSAKLIHIPPQTVVTHNKKQTRICDLYSSSVADIVRALNQNFGFTATEYLKITSQNFIKLIDTIGGIELSLSAGDAKFLSAQTNKKFNTGHQKLNGDQALLYIKNTNSADVFSAGERQTEAAIAIIEQLSSLNLPSLIKLVTKLSSFIITSLDSNEILEIAKWAMTSSPDFDYTGSFSGKIEKQGKGNDISLFYDLNLAKTQISDFLNK